VSVDLARDLGKFLGREVEIQNIPFDGLIPSLQTHKIDLIISSMTATAERAKDDCLFRSVSEHGAVPVGGEEFAHSKYGDADQPGRVLVVKKGTTGHVYATDKVKKAKRVLVLDAEAACVLEVVQGKADAFIYDQISTYENWRRNTETTRPILQPFSAGVVGHRLAPGRHRTAPAGQSVFAGLQGAWRFREIGRPLPSEQKAAFKKLGYPFYF
jgi:polar amino acid transport system substrate-binding protein